MTKYVFCLNGNRFRGFIQKLSDKGKDISGYTYVSGVDIIRGVTFTRDQVIKLKCFRERDDWELIEAAIEPNIDRVGIIEASQRLRYVPDLTFTAPRDGTYTINNGNQEYTVTVSGHQVMRHRQAVVSYMDDPSITSEVYDFMGDVFRFTADRAGTYRIQVDQHIQMHRLRNRASIQIHMPQNNTITVPEGYEIRGVDEDIL